VKLTVTDDKGATGSASTSVTVTAPAGPPNQAPTAAFTATPSGLSIAVDGSASTDADGTVSAYAWDFGDGTSGTGVTATHAYAASGTYTVKLTVTDDKGATGTTTSAVTVAAPAAAPFAADDFGRASGTALGAAVVGGTWTQTSGTANVAIDAGRAKLTSQAAGQTRSATLNATTSASTDLTFGFALPALPTGARMYVSALGRVVGSDDYRARWVIAPGGGVQAQLARGGTVLASLDLPGFTLAANTVYTVRVQVDGTGTTALRSKIWPAGTAEPSAWQLSTTDTTAALQSAGFTGFTTYAGTGFTGLPFVVLVDDFQAKVVVP
jgi:PKD repeat protein